jgi:DNA polymerase-1
VKKLYLVDVSSMFFRAFYAIRPLSNPAGMPVNAIYGFISMTVKLLREIRPDYMAFCFDRSEPSFRKDLDPRYKANRSDMPEDLVPQVPYIRTISEALGIPCLDKLGFEADDLIGTLTKIGHDHGLDVVIVSGDKDFAQLIKPRVSMYDTMKDIRYDENGVLEKWGVEPHKMIDYLAIVGDSSDNIKGVAGIGPKGAQKLLQDFGSLSGIYENLDKISSAAMKKKLVESKDEAFLAQKLVTIVCDTPLGMEPEDLRLKPILRAQLQALLTELDFKNFARTLLGETVPAAASPADDKTPLEDPGHSVAHVLNPQGNENSTIRGEAGSFATAQAQALAVAPPSPALELIASSLGVVVETRLDLGGLQSWLLPEQETWAFHTERASYLAQKNQGATEAWSIAEVAAHGPELGAMLTAKNLRYKGFDLKDFCKEHHVKVPNVTWDQMLAAYVVRAGPIEAAAPLFVLYNGRPLPELASSTQLLSAHVQLEEQLRKKIKAIEAEKVLFEIEQPLIPILLEMEANGILVDPVMLKKQSETLGRDIQVLEKEIHEAAGQVFNLGSPKQMGQILFEKLKMPTGKKNKTGFSTDTDVLEKLSKEFPITAKILSWRELTKLRSTYVDSLPLLIDKTSGRIHTTFNQATTTTGRLSSTNPNLQNIPIRTERGNMIRKAFIAPEGKTLLSADYSQIELRILAHITGDEGLLRAFEAGIDIHTATASEVFDVKVPDVTADMRRKAKAVNFGLAYGQGAFGLADTLRIPRSEATDIITRYFQRFPKVQSFMTDTVEEAKRTGFVQTIFGRRRYLDELFSKSGAVRKFGERAAVNAPIQGTASDLVKLAMIKVGSPAFAKCLLQVHDELVLEVDVDHIEEVRREVKHKMETIVALKAPLQVNTGTGQDWDQAHA